MKILFILHSHKFGGAEKHALLLVRELQRLGHDIFFAGPKDSWLAEEMQKNSIPCIHVPMHGLLDLWSHSKITWITKHFAIDMIHTHLTRGAFYGGLASKIVGIPAVSTAHATNTWKHFQYSKKIIAVSDAVKKFLLKKGWERKKITKIYNGVPIPPKWIFEQRAEKRADLRLGEKDIGLFMSARFIKDKGHDILIESLREIMPHYSFVHAYLAGEAEGSWAQHVRNLILKYNLSDRVHILGMRNDILELMAAMDLFVMPSIREAISLAILEACSVGIPTIGSSIGGIPEVIKHGTSGLLFPSGDSHALARCIQDLVEKSQKRREMGGKAKQIFVNKFTLSDMVKKTVNLYLEIIG